MTDTSLCPFCGAGFTDVLKHAVRAHKGQTITLSIAPVDTKHSIGLFESLNRLEAMAGKHAYETHSEEYLDWSILGALVRSLRRSVVINEAVA